MKAYIQHPVSYTRRVYKKRVDVYAMHHAAITGFDEQTTATRHALYTFIGQLQIAHGNIFSIFHSNRIRCTIAMNRCV